MPLWVSFATLPWGQTGHAQLKVGSTVCFWNQAASRFLSSSGSGVRGSAWRQRLAWAGLEDEISFFVVAGGGPGEVALYNLKSRRFLQVSGQQLQLSGEVNWEHLARMDASVVFKAVGSPAPSKGHPAPRAPALSPSLPLLMCPRAPHAPRQKRAFSSTWPPRRRGSPGALEPGQPPLRDPAGHQRERQELHGLGPGASGAFCIFLWPGFRVLWASGSPKCWRYQ